eukprot:TRINITY_DN1707_c2_g1_i1.p1 TRINITY_DN1707_c2_g1~~TRINITY_DN1707_c2_g1_i1.p1  ORF type:complete len:657 (-),score=136.11 TRINITY_DN1707_c2_g1_i1:83-2053(-)
MAARGANGGGNGQPQRQFSWIGLAMNLLIMYGIYSYFTRSSGPTHDTATGKALPPHRAIFKGSERLHLRVFMDEEADFKDFNNTEKVLWAEDDIFFDWRDGGDRSKEVNITPSANVMNNGTLYAHVYFYKHGYSPDPNSPLYKRSAVITRSRLLNEYLKKPKLKGRKNLISGELEDSPEALAEQEARGKEELVYISFWRPNMTINLVHDMTVFPRGGIPQQIKDHMQFDKNGDNYYPTLYFNNFWLLREHLYPINETTPVLPLRLDFFLLSMWKWQMMVQMDQSFAMQESLGAVEGEKDEVKRMLMETNPWLLGVTFFVSILHSVFDFMAFKNDITFWKERKSMEGLSVRSIFLSVFMQGVIFLYLLDNDTSWLIVISSGVGLAIEAWKITKAADVSIQRTASGFPKLIIKDKASYTATTKEYDDKAMKWLYGALFPLTICYSIYSLMYDSHKSWYSWVLGSLTGCIYTFGFIMMTPQLFINYKLKSVAAMPWRTFIYKALNTFVDDLFAFIIKMPTMHRLACFRDDIVFLIFLYQRWIYPVDKSRFNEYGQGGEDAPTTSDVTTTSAGTTNAATTLATKARDNSSKDTNSENEQDDSSSEEGSSSSSSSDSESEAPTDTATAPTSAGAISDEASTSTTATTATKRKGHTQLQQVD